MTQISLNQTSFISTFSGGQFHLFRPTRDEIKIEDIAHALSLLCRFTGHCKRFYSVAQHSVHASQRAPVGFEFEGLLHDAAEAYVNDLSRQLKHHPSMRGYVDIEVHVDDRIRDKFGLPIITTPPGMSPEVKTVDNCLVVTEARQLMENSEWTRGHLGYDDLILPSWGPEQAEQMFLRRFVEVAPAWVLAGQ